MGKALFWGFARAFLRNNEDQYSCGAQATGKWEKWARKGGENNNPYQVWRIFKGPGGRNEGFRAGRQNLFWKTKPEKRWFFSFNGGY